MSEISDQPPASIKAARPAVTWLHVMSFTVMAASLLAGVAIWVLIPNGWPAGLITIVAGLGFAALLYGMGKVLELLIDLLVETWSQDEG